MIAKVDEYALDHRITRAEATRRLLQAGLASLPAGFAADCGKCSGRGRVIVGKSGPHAGHFECGCGAHHWLSPRELAKLERQRRPSEAPAPAAVAS